MTAPVADLAARDRILDAHQKKALVRWLESELGQIQAVTDDAVSVNEARAILRVYELDIGDLRYLGGVFPRSRWRGVGMTPSDSGRCHYRQVRTFRPRHGVVIPTFPKPAWLDEPL